MKYQKVLIILIFLLGVFLRLYQLNQTPPGLDVDEASFVYHANSLLHTGMDRYGQVFPLAFRSFGTYLQPVYVYLEIIPVALFGLNVFSGRIVAVVFSILLLLITYFLLPKAKIVTLLLLSISPWAIFFGRGGHEATVALTLFIISILLFLKSLSNPKLIILVALIVGIASETYYTEWYLSLIFFPGLLWIYRDKFIKQKRYLILGLSIFLITQIPHLILLLSDAFTRRISQVNYFNQPFFGIIRDFVSHYLEYFSPGSLFFNPDPQLAKSMPDLSIFYWWMIIPLLLGVKQLLKEHGEFAKILTVLLILSPIPGALTKDPFYSMRALELFWGLTIVAGLGADYLLKLITSRVLKTVLIGAVLTISLISFYTSYFVLLKYEREDNYGYQYQQLVEKLKSYPRSQIVLDSGRFTGVHIWIPFYSHTDPRKFQAQVSSEIKNNYYNDSNLDEVTKIDNLQIRPIFWKGDLGNSKILIGDDLAISRDQIYDHHLTPVFQITGLDGKVRLKAYQTPP